MIRTRICDGSKEESGAHVIEGSLSEWTTATGQFFRWSQHDEDRQRQAKTTAMVRTMVMTRRSFAIGTNARYSTRIYTLLFFFFWYCYRCCYLNKYIKIKIQRYNYYYKKYNKIK